MGLIICLSHEANASHLRAGEITAVRTSCSSLTFIITITVYTNTDSEAQFGGPGEYLYFGDGSRVEVPMTPATVRTDLNPDGSVSTVSFTVTHTYPGVGRYLLRYEEQNRNGGVLNMDGSLNTPFYIETELSVDPFLGCNNTPVLLAAPIDQACTGAAFTHNPSAVDPDGDSLSYELVVPFRAPGVEVVNYAAPNDPRFYTDYEHGSEAGTRPVFFIHPTEGTLTWDAPGAAGEYNIAFHIIEWRKKNGVAYRVGYVRRDMQIIVEDCDNKRPDLIVPEDICVVAGTIIDESIFGIDPDNDPVKIEAFSDIFKLSASQGRSAGYSPIPKVNDFVPSSPPAETRFQWETECLHVREQPYQVVFKITDNPPKGPRLVTFKTWFIKVIGPAPTWKDARVEPFTREGLLKWDPYTCTNADSIQVWRRIDALSFEPDTCQTGMPDLGYELIATLPNVITSGGTTTSVTTYEDTNNGLGLAPGAKYCYRLVAAFPAPRGGESYVSDEICIGPVPAAVPVITHVSVEKTDRESGEIRVSWRKPFDANPVQFPPPYQYKVYRSTGLLRNRDSVDISPPGVFSDTTIVDTGLNTLDSAYNYSVTAFASNGIPLGNSMVASSVRLKADPSLQAITLSWTASVPWSNTLSSTPNRHLIYRGPEGATEADLVLIASVDVASGGFRYTDNGQWNNEPLVENEIYCYRVMTRGGYGNPKIAQPLNNFSQIYCTQLGDTIPPCKMEPPERSTLDYVDCNDYYQKFCEQEAYRNIIYWRRQKDRTCRVDVRSYNVYASAFRGGEFTLIAENITDTVFIDNNLQSFARCYKIAAVDISGNIGELSEELCIDNCPYYELPNVFTPNGDDYNNEFSAYSIRGYDCGEEGDCIPDQIRLKCARFVKSVTFTVYNRWGQEVFRYFGSVSSETNTIYIDWNGKNEDGNDLSSGVYYYVAEVVFDSVDPANNSKKLKGWVQLLR